MDQVNSLDTYVIDIKAVLDDIDKNSIQCIVSSKNQTKDWRKNQTWYNDGKSNECEKYQRNIIEQITNHPCLKCLTRINLENIEMKDPSKPLKNADGFEWTENFDGYQERPFKIYYNLKMICASGGAQTRTLREVYHFIKAQLDCLLKKQTDDVYFVNILDGDESFRNKDKFSYLKKMSKYETIIKYVFIGDLYEFKHWYQDLLVDDQQSDTPNQK